MADDDGGREGIHTAVLRAGRRGFGDAARGNGGLGRGRRVDRRDV